MNEQTSLYTKDYYHGIHVSFKYCLINVQHVLTNADDEWYWLKNAENLYNDI
jgi:hypothetical protein